MNQVIRLITGFGHIIILFNLFLLIILVFLKRFGFAEGFGNFLLSLSILLVALQMFKTKAHQSRVYKKVFFDKFLFLGWLGIILAAGLVFRSIFSIGPAVWGDAPFFYPETFKDFFNEPFVWESRGRLGIVNDLYWIYPLMLIYNGFGALLGLSNDVVIRLVFYFPAIFFSILSPLMFTKYFGFSPLVGIFSAALYSLNTYFILLIDGGQVGVALAYGLFPFTLLHLHKLRTNQTIFQFFVSLISFMMLIISDVRFASIALFSFFVWVILERINNFAKINFKDLKIFGIFLFAVLGLSTYWLIPGLLLEPTTGAGTRSDLQLISALNPIFLFAPHWPFNEFGKVFPPQWYFAGLPLLIFSNLLFKKNRQIFYLFFNFLLFVFLAKGDTGFLGNLYGWALDYIPLGGAFRDSTKFFAPLVLFAGILIGLSVQNIQQLFKKQIFSKLVIVLIFTYLLFLVYPALIGNMNGVLRGREFPKDIQVVADKISIENGFLRTVWFPERHPLGFNSERKPALDAKTLVNLRPFASLNVGTSDRFNFLHNKQFLDWLDIFGVRYLVFSGDTHKVLSDEEKEKDWDRLLSLVESVDGLDRVSWNKSFPVYQTKDSKPRIFAVDKVFAVVGGDDIYQKLIDVGNQFSIGNQGFVFFEDGKFDPRSLQRFTPESVVLVFNKTEKQDLLLSFLSEFFVSPMSATKSEWALRSTNEYLKWKFELLVNKVQTSEFDYGKGIAFSSMPNEKLIFGLNVKESGEYMFAIRHMSASDSAYLRISLAGQVSELPNTPSGRFEWYTKELSLNAGSHDLIVENQNGFQVTNVVALIPKKDWETANELSENLLSKFPVANPDSLPLSNWHEVSYRMVTPVEYKVEVSPEMPWLVFTDSYHPQWSFKKDNTNLPSYPFYSAINGFYMGQSGIKYGKIFFEGQVYIRWGIVLSLVFLAGFVIASVVIFKRLR